MSMTEFVLWAAGTLALLLGAAVIGAVLWDVFGGKARALWAGAVATGQAVADTWRLLFGKDKE